MTTRFISKFLIISGIILITGCKQDIINSHSNGATIVCLGGSVTLGKGADPGYDYPSQLSKMVNIPVINAGVNGNTTPQELARLPQDVLAHNPKIVIITQRANDFKKQISQEDSLKNLAAMFDQIQNHGAMVVLVTFEPQAMQDYFINFRKLAKEKHVLLIADIINDIEQNQKFMFDDIHPNNEGYKRVAERVYRNIKPYLN